jgi:integron integrase
MPQGDTGKPRLLEQVRQSLRLRHYSYRTEEQYLSWIRRFILFHHKRHPREMGAAEVEAFLNDLAVRGQVAAATQNQALAALLYLYRHVLNQELPWLNEIVRARRPRRVPMVLSREETRAVLAQLPGVYWLIGTLLYGGGLRLMECLRLRVQDIDFSYSRIAVREGKGGKDRVTILPALVVPPLRAHLEAMEERHRVAVRDGCGGVELPLGVTHKRPAAALEWAWQYVFPALRPSEDPRSGVTRRHHIMEDSVQRQMRVAVHRAGINKAASCHTLRHSSGSRIIPATDGRCGYFPGDRAIWGALMAA